MCVFSISTERMSSIVSISYCWDIVSMVTFLSAAGNFHTMMEASEVSLTVLLTVLLTVSSKQFTKSMDASPTKTASKNFKYCSNFSSDGSPKNAIFNAGVSGKPAKGLQSEGLSPKSRTCVLPSARVMNSGTSFKAWDLLRWCHTYCSFL